MTSSMGGGFLRDDTTGALVVKGLADVTDGRPGLSFPTGTNVAARSTALQVANRGSIVRGRPTSDITVSNLTLIVTTAATTDDPVDVGIYDASLNKIVSSGAVLGKMNSTGRKQIAITPTLLVAGNVYYVAMSYGAVGGTAATLAAVTFGGATVINQWGTAAGVLEGDLKNAVHPLPASWGALGGLGSTLVAPLLEP